MEFGVVGIGLEKDAQPYLGGYCSMCPYWTNGVRFSCWFRFGGELILCIDVPSSFPPKKHTRSVT